MKNWERTRLMPQMNQGASAMEVLRVSAEPKSNLTGEKVLLEVLLRKIRKGDLQARNDLIYRYIPLVLKTGWQVTGRYLHVGRDEEVSVGLLAMNEAIDSFKPELGASFASFIKGVIRKRLIDHYRRRKGIVEIPLSALSSEEDAAELSDIEERQAWVWGRVEEESRDRREEILMYSKSLLQFGIQFADLEKNSPQHKNARARAIICARLVATHPALRDHLMQRKELPLKLLERLVKVSRKTLERWRRYIIAVSLILIDNHKYLHGYIADSLDTAG